MSYDLKFDITRTINTIISDDPEIKPSSVSKHLTDYLNKAYPVGWVCLIGKRFTANVSHEPKHFIRISNEEFNIIVYKAIP